MQTISPTGAMKLNETAYGYVSTNTAGDIPVRIYKMGNPENRTWMPEVVGFPVLEEFEDLTSAIKFAETRATVFQTFGNI